MFNSAFDEVGALLVDFLPADKIDEINEVNALVYSTVNNGVYKSGFATTQEAYEEAVGALFTALDIVETRLGTSRYLIDDSITEADWRLFTTLIRFDAVYFNHLFLFLFVWLFALRTLLSAA